MNKNDLKSLLMSMRTPENASKVNKVLGGIAELSEEKVQVMIAQIGDDESVKKYLEEKISEREHDEKFPINDMFEYGMNGNCIHLHMPVDLHEMIAKQGLKKTLGTVNLYLLDAIEKIRNLRNNGYYKFADKDDIYMISPILYGPSMKFFEELDFETHSYKKQKLKNEEFVMENREAQLAIHIFGNDKNIGSAKIGLDAINTKEWQAKSKAKIKEFSEQGIEINNKTDCVSK